MSDHRRSPNTRAYRMGRRAERVDETRERITEAAVRLHTTVGPSRASIAAIAEAAGVTRLTVYRHFADLDAVYVACMAHWAARNPRPDAGAWRAIKGLEPRARRAFEELYGWFREHTDGSGTHQSRPGGHARVSASEAGGGEPGPGRRDRSWPGDGADGSRPESRLLVAVARHLVEYATWRSLAVDQGLGEREVVDVAVRMLLGVRPEGRGSGRRRAREPSRPRRRAPRRGTRRPRATRPR